MLKPKNKAELIEFIDQLKFTLSALNIHTNILPQMFGGRPTDHMVKMHALHQISLTRATNLLSRINNYCDWDAYLLNETIDEINELKEREEARWNR